MKRSSTLREPREGGFVRECGAGEGSQARGARARNGAACGDAQIQRLSRTASRQIVYPRPHAFARPQGGAAAQTNPAHVKISRWGKSCEREGRIMRPRRRMVP